MKDYAYPIFRIVISLIVAGHIVIMELALLTSLQIDGVFLRTAVLLATVLAVLLLSLTRFFIIPLFLYNISLYFIRDLLNEEINPALLLSSMAFIAVLLISQVYRGTEKNQATPKHAKPSYILTLAVLFLVVISGVSLLFNGLLVPNIPESAKFYLIKPGEVAEKASPVENPDIKNEEFLSMESSDTLDYTIEVNDAAGSTVIPIFKYINFFCLLTAVFLLALIFLLSVALVQFVRYKRQERFILQAAPADQAILIYRYALSMLARYGWNKEEGMTPYEFAARAESDFPFPTYEFQALTQTFVEAKYGQYPVTDTARNACLEFYRSIPLALKVVRGTLRYYIEAILKYRKIESY